MIVSRDKKQADHILCMFMESAAELTTHLRLIIGLRIHDTIPPLHYSCMFMESAAELTTHLRLVIGLRTHDTIPPLHYSSLWLSA